MPKAILASATVALLFALGAGAAYAQDADMTDKDVADAVMESAEDTMEAAEDTMEAAEELQEQVDGDAAMNAPDTTMTPVTQDTPLMEGTTMEDTANVVAPSPAPVTSTPIACPEGTTAQPDGTCMVTGDFALD